MSKSLSDVSFQVDKGETICVLGPSGSGKSTLLRCINWLERPTPGKSILNGERVGINGAGIIMSDRDLSQIRTRIGMVFQHFALWPHPHGAAKSDGSAGSVQRRPKAEVRDEALALLAKVGLSEKRDAFPARLSGGRSSASASRGARDAPGSVAVRRTTSAPRSGTCRRSAWS